MRIESEDLSVIIPAYNEEANILTILKTLEQQSLKGFGVIVVDDGSTDNTATLVESFKPQQFKLQLLKQDNKGAARARESAIHFCKSKFIAVIDCDDSLAIDSLEKAYAPLITDPSIEISLFKLNYVDSTSKEVTGEFICYTGNNKLKGKDVFANCVSSWGVHAFGIYNRDVILSAYKMYNAINSKNENYLNNDEVISRISFDLANTIFLSDGKYYFINNINSTTRRVNNSYFKVLHNAFYLSEYIEKRDKVNSNDALVNAAYALIISTIWGVSVRYFKWSKYLTPIEKESWRHLIKRSVKRVIHAKRTRKLDFTHKSKLQLILLGVIF